MENYDKKIKINNYKIKKLKLISFTHLIFFIINIYFFF